MLSFSLSADQLLSPFVDDMVGPARIIDTKLDCEEKPNGEFEYSFTVRVEPVTSTVSSASCSRRSSRYNSRRSSRNNSRSSSNRPSRSNSKRPNCRGRRSAGVPKVRRAAVPVPHSRLGTKYSSAPLLVKFILVLKEEENSEPIHIKTSASFKRTDLLREIVWYFQEENVGRYEGRFNPRMAMLFGDTNRPINSEDLNQSLYLIVPECLNTMYIYADLQ